MNATHVLDVLLRTTVLAVGAEGAAWLSDKSDSSGDPLAAGLTAFAVMVLLAALGGMIDGFRWPPLRLCLTWLATGVLVALAISLWSAVQGEPIEWSILIDDLVSGLPFLTLLVAVPAIACGIVQSTLNKPATD